MIKKSRRLQPQYFLWEGIIRSSFEEITIGTCFSQRPFEEWSDKFLSRFISGVSQSNTWVFGTAPCAGSLYTAIQKSEGFQVDRDGVSWI